MVRKRTEESHFTASSRPKVICTSPERNLHFGRSVNAFRARENEKGRNCYGYMATKRVSSFREIL